MFAPGQHIRSDKTAIFITLTNSGYSRSWNYYSELLRNSEKVEFLRINPKNTRNFLTIRRNFQKQNNFIIMSPSHLLVFQARIFLGKNIYLDAGWSLFEGSIISRRNFGFLGFNALKSYLIDFLAALFAKKIILESYQQKNFYSRLFLVKPSKCHVIYTGVNEADFKPNSQYKLPSDLFNNSKIVLFRGKYSTEAGLEVLAQTTNLLASEKITIWVLSPGMPETLIFSKNTIVIRDYLESPHDLAAVYNASSLTLGQLSNHSRLGRTIPHKAYESAFLAKPYLSARTKGILELFVEDREILCFEPANAFELAQKIKDFFNNPDKFEGLGQNMRKKYDLDLSQSKLAKQLLEVIEKS